MPETQFEKRKYKIRYECELCGHQFTRTCEAIPIKDPPCPKFECRTARALVDKDREIARLKQMLEEQSAPALVGANTQVRAIDQTAEIVMKDYELTDLKDNIRQGETMAPKLQGQQKQMADFMNGTSNGSVKIPDFATGGQHTVSKRQMDRIGRRALAGAYKGMAINQQMITPDAAVGQSPLTVVRTERAGK